MMARLFFPWSLRPFLANLQYLYAFSCSIHMFYKCILFSFHITVKHNISITRTFSIHFFSFWNYFQMHATSNKSLETKSFSNNNTIREIRRDFNWLHLYFSILSIPIKQNWSLPIQPHGFINHKSCEVAFGPHFYWLN